MHNLQPISEPESNLKIGRWGQRYRKCSDGAAERMQQTFHSRAHSEKAKENITASHCALAVIFVELPDGTENITRASELGQGHPRSLKSIHTIRSSRKYTSLAARVRLKQAARIMCKHSPTYVSGRVWQNTAESIHFQEKHRKLHSGWLEYTLFFYITNPLRAHKWKGFMLHWIVRTVSLTFNFPVWTDECAFFFSAFLKYGEDIYYIYVCMIWSWSY